MSGLVVEMESLAPLKNSCGSLKTLSCDILDISHSKPAAFPHLRPSDTTKRKELWQSLQSSSAFVTGKGERFDRITVENVDRDF